ncbi:hypothetical protein GCM10010965_08160 [Caldalkalibacillus thermarum]|nr:hypothetical protein GCM10010965_08160 [Caldalkalibacillus thermarum]
MIAYNPVMVMQGANGDSLSVFKIILTLLTGMVGVFGLSLPMATSSYPEPWGTRGSLGQLPIMRWDYPRSPHL